MNFAELNEEYVLLRRSLRTHVGENALDEITIHVPKGHDHACFLLLLAWGYVFAFEAGRISVPYLLKEPADQPTDREALKASRDLLHDLRTWSFHNLSFTVDRDLQIFQRTAIWFLDVAGNDPPDGNEQWRECYEHLSNEIYAIIKHCRRAFEIALTTRDERERVTSELRRRVDRNWPAHEFDALAKDAALRTGRNLDVTKFRQPRLAKWREFLETIPIGDDPKASLVRLIERDILDHFESVLPIDGNDVMRVLEIAPGPQVGDALLDARRIHRSGVADKDELLARLVQMRDNAKGGL